MTAFEPSPKTDEWMPENQDTDLENEAERNNSRSDTENNHLRCDSDENGLVSESEKGNFIFETDESDIDSDRFQSDEKIQDDGVIGSGDGQTDTDFTACSESPKCEVDIRHRVHQDVDCQKTSLGLLQKEPAKHDQTGYPYFHVDRADSQKEVTSRNNIPGVATTSGARNATSHRFIWSWFEFLAPRAVCIIVLSLIYLGLAILSIRMLRLSTQQY